jgi:hypothetical protein
LRNSKRQGLSEAPGNCDGGPKQQRKQQHIDDYRKVLVEAWYVVKRVDQSCPHGDEAQIGQR